MQSTGLATHWAYKRGGKATASEKELRWINNLIELQEGAGGDAQTFVDSVKEDIFTERIYVFTPDGAVRELCLRTLCQSTSHMKFIPR